MSKHILLQNVKKFVRLFLPVYFDVIAISAIYRIFNLDILLISKLIINFYSTFFELFEWNCQHKFLHRDLEEP